MQRESRVWREGVRERAKTRERRKANTSGPPRRIRLQRLLSRQGLGRCFFDGLHRPSFRDFPAGTIRRRTLLPLSRPFSRANSPKKTARNLSPSNTLIYPVPTRAPLSLSLCLFKQEEKGDGQRTSVLVPNTRPKKRCPDGSSCQLVRNSQSILKSFAILPKAQSGYIVFYSIIPHGDNPVFQYASRHPSLRPFPSLAR